MASDVFIYWDNSNIFHSAQEVASERNGESDSYYRLRIDFRNLYKLASADRPVKKAIAAGSIPPAMTALWNVLEGQGIKVDLFQRGGDNPSEQEVPDERLQLAMLRDVLDNRDNPGTIVLLTGDGRGYDEGRGFFRTIEDIDSLDMGWDIELLSWEHTCHQRMKDWVEEHGTFISLDDYYESVTFLERNDDDPYNLKLRDRASKLDLTARPLR
ncbi:MAG: NYN domain-containing protein [Gemmatimonadetes bacterium]|nr:NYN domain-containing protein [Gemmatimonadota bacterium]MXY47864.1 NYN domain-containing protein [Gemmatimonadota bacterium]MYG85975.1 NYN domain-containing protein [Gemmatimonadota bacterium]MYJ90041.1 NYN domain-containing protein [Gemmatimonadota bacterium]